MREYYDKLQTVDEEVTVIAHSQRVGAAEIPAGSGSSNGPLRADANQAHVPVVVSDGSLRYQTEV